KQRKGEPMHYAAQPAAMASLAASDDDNIRKRMAEIEPIVAFGGAYVPPPPPTPLDEAQQRRFTAGELLFAQSCASCHGSGGLGIEGQAPPLLDSPWVLESPKRAASIALLGVSGPIEVHGRVYDLEMPGHAAMQDEEIASILTYIR